MGGRSSSAEEKATMPEGERRRRTETLSDLGRERWKRQVNGGEAMGVVAVQRDLVLVGGWDENKTGVPK